MSMVSLGERADAKPTTGGLVIACIGRWARRPGGGASR